MDNSYISYNPEDMFVLGDKKYVQYWTSRAFAIQLKLRYLGVG